MLGKATRKRVGDALTAEKSKTETEITSKMQQKSQETRMFDNEKLNRPLWVAPITTGYAVNQ